MLTHRPTVLLQRAYGSQASSTLVRHVTGSSQWNVFPVFCLPVCQVLSGSGNPGAAMGLSLAIGAHGGSVTRHLPLRLQVHLPLPGKERGTGLPESATWTSDTRPPDSLAKGRVRRPPLCGILLRGAALSHSFWPQMFLVASRAGVLFPSTWDSDLQLGRL